MDERDGVTPPRLAVVDDNPHNLRLLQEELESRGYRVLCFPRAEMALRAAERRPPDLFLLDVQMPGMDGYALCEALKRRPALADVPVIFASAKVEPEDKLRGFEAGAVDYVTKPLQMAEVHARVAAHVKLHRQRQLLETQKQALEEAQRFRAEVEAITQHDLKSPLTAIIGFARLLTRPGSSLGERDRELATRIARAGVRMQAIVNTTLDTFRMEQGLYVPEATLVNLTALAQEVAAEARALREGVAVELTGPGTPVQVLGDERLVWTILANLAKNAVEASPPGAVVTLEVDPAGSLAVRNRGEVPASVIDRFFEKHVTAGKVDGTGLGTYTVRLAAELLGAAVSLDASEPGHTSIEVTFPAPTIARTG
ncbi:MAG: hybrid sensor histidine kinase/response regulator [Myxococcota bacterium]|nr:hybrid sensor histidine kinase/response regulator [Myxococcota bacterium]